MLVASQHNTLRVWSTPVPFASISFGINSTDKIALNLAGTEVDAVGGFVVTEAKFNFTMSGERLFVIEC